jgi:mannose-6-phosphate isomerase-like protein (cupin superfamily)
MGVARVESKFGIGETGERLGLGAKRGTMMVREVHPQVVRKDEGPARWFLNTLTFVKATAETTRGAFGLIDQLIPAGFATPYHLHHAEDEAFYILEGEATFISNGKKVKVGPGAYVFGPREVPHGFRIEGAAPARMLVLTTPGGFEGFVVDMSEPATELALPQPTAPNMQKLVALAARYNIEILGPLPE